MPITPFHIEVGPDRLALLDERLKSIVWPNVPAGVDGHGVSIARVQELVDHWRSAFQWSQFEQSLNEFEHLLHDDGAYPLHVVRARSSRGGGVPIVLLHGWPDTFLRYRKLIPLLTAAGHDVIVPSLPGFAFSGQPVEPLTAPIAAERVRAALVELGLTRYVLHGGDFGSVIADEIATAYPEDIVGLHLTDVPFPKQFMVDRDTLDADEQSFFAASDVWMERAVYFMVQSAEPLTLAYALTDSPVGLLAWILDKFDGLSDTVDPDDVIGLTALTWLTGTAWSGMRLYADDQTDWDDSAWEPGEESEGDSTSEWGSVAADSWGAEPVGETIQAAFSIFPRDIGVPPQALADRFYDVVQWTTHDRGGHFAATECPEALAADLLNATARFTR